MIDLEINNIISPKLNNGIKQAEKTLLMFNLPKVWNINQEGNSEREMEIEFEKFMLAVSEQTNEKIDNINVFRFYSLLELLKERNAKNK